MTDGIGIAIIGLGRVFQTHIDSIQLNPETTRLAAVVDIDEPLVTSLADGKEMVQKAQEKGLILMTGQCFRFMAGFLEAKRRLKEAIGEPFNLVYLE